VLKSVIYSVTTNHSQSRKRAICTTKRHTVNPKNKSRKNKAMSSSSSSSEKIRNEKRVEIRKKFDIQKGSRSFTLSLGEVLAPRSAERGGRTGTASTQSRGGRAPCHHAKSGTDFHFHSHSHSIFILVQWEKGWNGWALNCGECVGVNIGERLLFTIILTDCSLLPLPMLIGVIFALIMRP